MSSDSRKKRLQELRGSDFEMAKGQPDIRGWEVVDPAGHKVGKVHELVFDTEAKRVRYMIVNIADSKELQLEKRTVLVPIGLAELHRAHDSVVLPQVTPFQLRALPKYDKDHLGPKAEMDISAVFGRSHTAIGTDEAHSSAPFYDHDHFNESNLYRNRPGHTSSDTQRQTTTHHRDSDELKDSGIGPAAYTPKGESADTDGILRNREQTLRDDEERRRREL
jgi:sporulation protein YlmC with PRC-barrel domain